MEVLQFIAGLAVLLGGAEILVRGASRLAAAMGISPLVVGLTVVAYGTSAPELAVSLDASLTGRPDLALGNVVGSNIMNVLLVLGIAGAIAPVAVAPQLIRSDIPFMIGVSAVLLLLCLDGAVAQWEGAVLFAGAVIYTVVVVRAGRRQWKGDNPEGNQDAKAKGGRATAVNVVLTVGGLVLLPLGAHWIVESASTFAVWMGMSEVLVGLTIVAVGTSLPEIAATVVAAIKGERDLAVGNVVGSNVFNILLVVGLTGAVVPGGLAVPASLILFDLPIMVAVACTVLPICYTHGRIDRWEAMLFLACYGAYLVYLIWDATGHKALPGYSRVMTLFVVPVTFLTLLILAYRYARGRKA